MSALVNPDKLSVMRYRLPEQVQLFQRGDKYVFINPLLPAWIVTNDLGRLIVEQFDGCNTVEDIVEAACQVLGNDKRKEVEAFCDHVIDSSIFETKPHQQPPRDKGLHCVHLSMTSSCNLRCKYCYAAERIEGQYPQLTLEEYKHLIDDLCELSSGLSITITGGEPLLNPLWQPVSTYCKSKGCELLLLTNGTLINEQNAAFIKETFDLVTLSIDGPTRETHRLTRGDNFDQVMHAVEILERHGIDYTLSMTVTRLNIDQVEAMAQRFGGRLNYAPLFPVSDLADDELSITGDEYYNALANAFGVNPLSYCETSLDVSKYIQNRKCAIGDNEISISPTGDAYPCQLLHLDEFLAGNVHERSIKDIYHGSPALQRCATLDVDSIEKCRDCAIRYICGGACRARGYYETGDVAASGDFCNYELNAFLDGIVKIYSHNLL
jgi:radical SAM protein with 4Fe4S-binding SPASM domain